MMVETRRKVTYSSLHELLDTRILDVPRLAKVVLGGESKNPKVDTKNQTEETAEGGQVTRDLEPAASRRDHTGDGREEGNEDEDGIGNTGYKSSQSRFPLYPLAPFRHVSDILLDRRRTCQWELGCE